MDPSGKLEVTTIETRNGKVICTPDLILFSIQVFTISLVVAASLVNLSLGTGNQQLWTVILTGSLGYLMPNPHLKILDAKLPPPDKTDTVFEATKSLSTHTL